MNKSVPFEVQPLNATFGAIITGIRLADITDTQFQQLYQVWLNYALLIFPGQNLSNDEQTAFAERFGELEFKLAPISNVLKDGSVRSVDANDDVMKILKGNMGWHADSTYMPVQAKGAVFTAHVVPDEDGETGWADMRAAWDALDNATQSRLETLSAYHSLHYSQAKAGFNQSNDGEYSGYGFHDDNPPLRPLVKVHPETGRKSLLIGRHAFGIPGLPEADSEQILDDLMDFACQEPRVYYHHWQPGDVALWDNRCLLHRACMWNMTEPRVMYHARIRGDDVTEAAQTAQA
ncbi:MAG: TauD/TfdA family dioxygenase [Pseudomonadales bacterium]|nr:TauD/TfdA family dioxygenase [Pseudomonadales bacterium]